MTPTQDGPVGRDLQDILRQVERRRSAQIAGLVIVVIFAVLALLARLSNNSLVGIPLLFWGSLAVVLLLGKIVFNVLAWRCPSCGGSLGSTYWPRFCPSCGIRLKGNDQDEGAR